MSELRVALVAEGKTDRVLVEAALKALLPRPFVLTLLQPEALQGTTKYGEGWGGVLRWCRAFSARGFPSLEADPTLEGFDLFVLHLDADVAGMSYGNVSPALAEEAALQGWPPLPCDVPCPPPSGSVDSLRLVMAGWAGVQAWGARTVLCVPSKAIESWLAAALLPAQHDLLNGLECNLDLEGPLSRLPLKLRVKKTQRDYQGKADDFTKKWNQVRTRCSQAERFSVEIAAAV